MESFLSGGRVGSSFLSSAKATLKASTRIRSRVAWAERYLAVARRLLRFSSLLRVGGAMDRVFPSASSASSDTHPTFISFIIDSASDCPQCKSESGCSGLSIIFSLFPNLNAEKLKWNSNSFKQTLNITESTTETSSCK